MRQQLTGECQQIEDSSGSAVILSKEDYEGLLETLELLSVPGFREGIQRSLQQIADGETFSLDEVLGDIAEGRRQRGGDRLID